MLTGDEAAAFASMGAHGGKLDPDESMSLQENLVRMHKALYLNSLSLLCEICDGDVDCCDTYNDGRRFVTNSCVDPKRIATGRTTASCGATVRSTSSPLDSAITLTDSAPRTSSNPDQPRRPRRHHRPLV